MPLALGIAKMAPSNTRQSKAAYGKRDHELSEEDSSGDENGKEELFLSDEQMEAVSLLVKSAVSAAVAQVLPLAQQINPQNAMGGASTSSSAQGTSSVNNSDPNSTHPIDGHSPSNEEDGEIHDEEMDEYEKALVALLGDNKVTGPEINKHNIAGKEWSETLVSI